MSDDQLIIQEGLFPQNNTATLFHRTSDVESIPKILKSGWSSGGYGLYGVGVYTTYLLEDQFNQYMRRYGNVLVKFKYVKLDSLLCFTPAIAKDVHKDKYLIVDQIQKILPNYKLSDDDLEIVKVIQDIADKATYSSDAAKYFVDAAFFSDLHSKLNGIEYQGRHDGHCIVIYPPGKGLELIAYAKNAEITSNIDADVKKLNWFSTGTKKTFSKAFDKGIFTTPDIELPIPTKPSEKIPFMEFIRNLKEKNEVTDKDVVTLFTYSFSSKSLLGIFEKLNPNLLRSDAFLIFFTEFGVKNDTAAQLKVLQVGLQYRPSALLEYLYKSYNKYEQPFKKEISQLLFTTNLEHLGEQGRIELGKVFSRFISDDSNDTDQLKHKIIDYIIKNNLYKWFNNVRFNQTQILFQHVFKKASDIIEFITKAKANNFNINEVIPYIASWFNHKFDEFYTDADLLNVIELLKNYSNTGVYFNSDNNSGPVSYRLTNIYLTNSPEKITAQMLPSIFSSVTEKNVDLLDKINPSLFKEAERTAMWNSLKNLIVESPTVSFVQKIWKYALLTSLDHNDYIEILNDHLSSDATTSRYIFWETLFKNIVSTYILSKNEVVKILDKLKYPSDNLIELILNELSGPNQFDKSIFYVLLEKTYRFLSDTRIFKWLERVNQQYPGFIKNAISQPEFPPIFLEQQYQKTDLAAYLYLTYAPDYIEKLTSEQLTSLVRNLRNIGGAFQNPFIVPLISKYLQSDIILNKADETLQEIILAAAPSLSKDDTYEQTVLSVLEKLMAKNPNVINNFGGYYMDKFLEHSKNKKSAIDFILKYKNTNLNFNDIRKLLDMAEGLNYNPSLGVTPDYVVSRIFEIKKDKLDEASVNVLVSHSFSRSKNKLTSIQIIDLLKKYNPKYVNDIDSSNWSKLIENTAYTQNEFQKIEDIIFSLPISVKTNTFDVKEALIDYSKNKSKTINRMLDSGLFTNDDATLEKMMQYPIDKTALNKIIKIYRFDLMDGEELAELYNRLGGYSHNTGDYTFKNNKNAVRMFVNEIGNRLNTLGSKEQVQFISYAGANSPAPFLIAPFQLVTMRVRDISTDLFKSMLFSLIHDQDGHFHSRGPSTMLKILLRYNNTGWNIENFFDAVSNSDFQNSYQNILQMPLKLNELFALTLKYEKQNLKARTLKAMLNHGSEEEKKKIIDIVLNPEFKGSSLDSNDVFVIVSSINQMYDDPYATKVILQILRLVNQNITDAMLVNLVGLCPENINNQSGHEYVANRILIYRKNNLSESAIYNLIKLQSNDDSKLRIIDKILALKSNTLTAQEIYHIITQSPIKGLRGVVSKLLEFYDKNLISRILIQRGFDIDNILAEMKNYKKYYNFLHIIS